jgi:hypothetical protein
VQKLWCFLKELKRPPNIIIIVSSVTFVYIWGIWGWTESELWSKGWRFDLLGHAIFGFGAAYARLYLYLAYSAHGFFLFTGQRHIRWDTVKTIALYGFFWEFFIELLLWDNILQPNYFSNIATAQKGNIDTMLDMFANWGAASLAMTINALYNAGYEKKYPAEAEKQERESALKMVEHVGQMVKSSHHSYRKHLWLVFKNIVKQKIPHPKKHKKEN